MKFVEVRFNDESSKSFDVEDDFDFGNPDGLEWFGAGHGMVHLADVKWMQLVSLEEV